MNIKNVFVNAAQEEWNLNKKQTILFDDKHKWSNKALIKKKPLHVPRLLDLWYSQWIFLLDKYTLDFIKLQLFFKI